MKKVYEIVPYVSVGEIKFGMKKEEVIAVFGKEPDLITKGFLGTIELQWESVVVRFNKKGLVNEVSFLPNNNVFFNGRDILNDPETLKILSKLEKPYITVGFKVFFNFGIAVTGFSKKIDHKALTVFSKELVKVWKE
ncbi:hypothetical protein ACFSX9_10745 [Flavobacterium ardleyense]|uniref:Uncharacterized protein n=1 Tax=Flavobacterium ardleyense TaxID=2038737 RepID=A0ABW5Z9Q0_9FLAO